MAATARTDDPRKIVQIATASDVDTFQLPITHNQYYMLQ